MSMYSGIDDPSVGIGGNRLYFSPGTYRCKIECIKSKKPAETFDGIGCFIVECIILHSSNPILKPGAVVGWVQKMHKDPKKGGIATAFARVKGFLAAALKTTDFDAACKELGLQSIEQLVEVLSSEANPLRGRVVDLVCSAKRTKPKADGTSNEVTAHAWHSEGTLTL